MLLAWDLGISSLALVVCLVVPLIGFVVGRQWRLAAQRREEIRRLLIRASEEAARAELEASLEYSSVSVSNGYYCPVCYVPATTRCARCKAVRYCSGKCQVYHWRQGHKNECRPAPITCNTGNEKSDSGLKVAEKNEVAILDEVDLQCAESAGAAIRESAVSNATSSLEDKIGGIADVKDDPLIDKEEAVSVAETSGSSFSGFSSSLSNDSSDDDISICESFSNSDSERPEPPLDADIGVESVETCFDTDDAVPSEPMSPKFTHLVESVDNLANMATLSQSKLGGNVEENQSRSSCLRASVMDRHRGSTDQSPAMSSGFWGRALGTIECVSDPSDCFGSSKSDGADEESLSDTCSSMPFSIRTFTVTSTDPDNVSKAKSNISDEISLTALETDKANDRILSRSSKKATSGSSRGCYTSSPKVKTSLSTISSATPASVVREVPTSVCPLDNTVLSFVALEKLKSADKENDRASDARKTGEFTHFASKNADTGKTSDDVEPSHLTKSGRVPDIQKRNAVTLHVTNSLHEENGFKASVLKVVDQWTTPKSSNQYKLLTGNEITRKHSHKGLFPYDFFIKLYNWNKLELQPCGLINCGNSCFANVVFQCLMFTPPLTAYFLQGIHSKTCPNREQCFTCGFENLVLKAKEGKSPLYPSGLLAQLQNIGICLGNGKEEDAHEFLRYVVDTMQSVCLKESKHAMLETAKLEETTLIGLTFGGYLRSKVKCMKCQGKSERCEKMMDLTVEVDGDVSTLDDALRRFTRTEILDGENKYKCGRCKSYERAKKKLKILEPPNVLTIALKRFQSGKFGKLNKLIRFSETLDLAPYVSGRSDKPHVYKLYGVIVHLDIMNAAFSGHYVCYIKNSQNKWYKADDSTVVTSELERVLTKGAYMLFYARCSPRPPSTVCTKSVSTNKNRNMPLPKIIGKSTAPLPRPASTPSSKIPEGGGNSIQSFYSKFHRLQRILEEDSSSDSSSLFDSNSDECSCSTESTRDSTSIDDFADFIFGERGLGDRHSPHSGASSSSSSSSVSSPLPTKHSPLAESERSSSELPETSSHRKR
ncbi:PREDICTED: ubiquitin carboxyl-terminal hydrolase 16-like [Tarenaya hassleriana]|uniref:ubiquitin carboxyl-terminal hydrolase 16-like n=1 Tax=Tarenaya hassleriana TaxID=28532 RepID=UPI00053C968E|nr:PREDICTED: ubiquitin carboxyl-terminal hydrolase 16-like [Tarenaya hassleriana]